MEDKKFSGKEDDAFHFIAYVPFEGKLYELDGLQQGPIDLGLSRFPIFDLVHAEGDLRYHYEPTQWRRRVHYGQLAQRGKACD
jgi:hypothetical protein